MTTAQLHDAVNLLLVVSLAVVPLSTGRRGRSRRPPATGASPA